MSPHSNSRGRTTVVGTTVVGTTLANRVDSLRPLVATLVFLTVGLLTSRADAQTFEPPEPLTELNTERQEKSPCISDDGLELWFQSDRVESFGVTYWVYVARRSHTAAPFGEPERIVIDAANPDLSSDGLTLWIARDTAPGEDLDIDLFVMRRASRDEPFGDPEPVSELNTPYKDGSSSITADELTVFFHSDRPGSVGKTDIWMATRASKEQPFDPPFLVPAVDVNTDAVEFTPSITPDGLTLYFASTREEGQGMSDIWVARRSTIGESFGPAQPLVNLNTDGTEKACDISADGLTLYLRTKTVEGDNVSEIQVAYDVRSGTVNRAGGANQGVDVLFVNDSAGDATRTVVVGIGAPLSVRLDASPAGPASPRYALYAFPAHRRTPHYALQPHSIGATAFATPLDGGHPQAVVLGSRFNGPEGARFGEPRFDLPPAPGIVLDAPGGYSRNARFLLQAFLLDNAAAAPVPLAVSNAVEVVVE